MARPLKTGLDYYQHDTSMSADEKIEALEAVHGNDGYAVFNKLLERIYKSYGKLDLSDDVQRLSIAKKCNVTAEKFEQIVQDSVRFGLFEKAPWDAQRALTSERIRAQIATVETIRDAWKDQKKTENPSYPVEDAGLSARKTPVIRPENPSYPAGKVHRAEQSRAEESKVRAEQSRAARPLPEIDDLRKRLKSAPWPLALPDSDLSLLASRIANFGTDSGFIGYAIDRTKREGGRSPAGLLKKGLLAYDEWIQEYAAQASKTKATDAEKPDFADDPPPCACGGKIKADIYLGTGCCLDCGKWHTWDRSFRVWTQDKAERSSA